MCVAKRRGGRKHHRRRLRNLGLSRRQIAAHVGGTRTSHSRNSIVRARILVLTHRPNDYHPDHRAVGQAVQDASYMVTVPLVVPGRADPGTRSCRCVHARLIHSDPYPLVGDVVVDITEQLDTIIDMLACHRLQVFEFLPFNQGIADQVPQRAAGAPSLAARLVVRHYPATGRPLPRAVAAAVRLASEASKLSVSRHLRSANTRRRWTLTRVAGCSGFCRPD